jgi:hypothetical protein
MGSNDQAKHPETAKSIVHTTNVAACHELAGPNASLPKSVVIHLDARK